MKHPRLIRHETAFSYMKNGEFNLAIIELKNSIAENGPHVLSLIDLAASYNCATDYDNFVKYTNIAWNEYKECFTGLSLKSKFHATLGLGRILEEAGRLAEALEVYTEYLGLDFTETETALKRQIECELLRVYAMLGDREKSAGLYLSLLQTSKVNEAIQPDLVHCLVLAEYQHIGFDTAMSRLAKSLDSLTPHNKRLVFFDFLFELLLNSEAERIDAKQFEGFLYLECDPFERAVWDIYLAVTHNNPVSSLDIHRANEMSPLCSIRYLALLDQYELLPNEKIELRNKINLLLLALDLHTRKLVSRIWKQDRKSAAITILETGIQTEDGTIVPLQKQQKIMQFLNLVMVTPGSSPADISFKLFDLDYSESVEARLRTLIVRINKIFEVHAGVQKAFTLTKSSVVVNANLKLLKSV